MISDLDLSAYLDGELAAERAREIDAAVAADPQLAARLDRLRRTDGSVAAAFDAMLDQPVPTGLEAAIRASVAAHEAAATPDNVVPFARARRPAPRWALPVSIAASLVVGVLVGRAVGPAAGPAQDWVVDARLGTPTAAAAMAAGLSRSPSGVAFDVAGGRRATVVLTFASRGGDLCRQFTVAGGTASQSGLACRTGGAAWRLVALASSKPGGGDYQTAAGPGEDAVSAMTDRLIEGEPMDAAREAGALAAAQK